jgi:UDP-N-acetylmuramoyl-L-alanyl-D-glutamate--2,6-diaminopimelate ligase
MRLKTLISSLDCKVLGAKDDCEVTGISTDSRDIKKGQGGGALFAAIPGEHVDGHAFIKTAVTNGAACVVAERPEEGVTVPQVIVPDVRAALSRISDVFYGEPSKKLIMTGVTGTNGKTTTTYLLESIFREAGFNPGVIGTVNYRYGGKTFPATHTTPDAPYLHKILREMCDAGVTHCVMEVSSHSLAQKRVNDCRFNVGVFTNLTHEHLDYHRTMEEYFRCKSVLFRLLKDSGGFSVVNVDDPWGEALKKEFPAAYTCSLKEGATFFPAEYKLKEGLTEASIKTPAGRVQVSSHLVGEYNLQNILGAIGAGYALGVDCDTIGRGINALARVPGRLEKIEMKRPGAGPFRAYVDYAHTGDALERALGALKRVSSGRIITVFGCGGNRDRLKRPKMGSVSARLSDVSIITSDNPRDEDPLEIIKEIETGLTGVKKSGPDDTLEGRCYTVIPERGEAIRKAVKTARKGDTILVAGKGHEDYQIIKGKKAHFDDFEVLNEALRELGG